jgi:hypothetical protein
MFRAVAAGRQAIPILCALAFAAVTPGAQSPATPAAAPTAALIPANTVIAIHTVDPIDSDTSSADKDYKATVDDAVVIEGVTIAPIGTPALLRVVRVEQAGAVKGHAKVSLRLTALDINGQRVAVETGDATISSGGQAAKATKSGAGGAVVGGILGGIFGGKGGAAKGVAAGSGQKVHVPAETRLSFTLTAPTEQR